MIQFEDLVKDTELCKAIQEGLIRQGFLDPPVDGKAGKLTRLAFNFWKTVNPELELGFLLPKILPPTGSDLASRVVRRMLSLGYFVSRGAARYNIVYLEGANLKGEPIKDTFNNWNDLRMVIEWRFGDEPKLIDAWAATTEPGLLTNPLPKGTAMIPLPSQYKAWQVGVHKAGTRTAHEALVQVAPITILRSKSKPPTRVGAIADNGLFGINQHHGWGATSVNNNSAGCAVGQSVSGHIEFMSLCKSDARYGVNKSYIFYSTFLDAAKV